jgi:hypothetical protein
MNGMPIVIQCMKNSIIKKNLYKFKAFKLLFGKIKKAKKCKLQNEKFFMAKHAKVFS